jgi:hypothetical protein
VSLAPNPIARRGYATTLALSAGRPVTLRYRVEAMDL